MSPFGTTGYPRTVPEEATGFLSAKSKGNHCDIPPYIPKG